MDFDALRDYMVRTQLIPRGIRDERVIAAMRKVPRHIFVPETMQQRAYDDMALSIGEGQTISQPYMVAIMTELLELKGGEKVLEIGTGSGYQAAILAELSREVYTVERIAALGALAEERLRVLAYRNVQVKIDDGTLGWIDQSPFDRILITAGAPKVPDPLLEQLAEDGILLAPVGDRYSQQLVKKIKGKGGIREELHTLCVFVPLIGRHGWKDSEEQWE
jgi:protein-L-isoaspartate(D-aspartate) O-methyltransferase